jgi:hypothetical protein
MEESRVNKVMHDYLILGDRKYYLGSSKNGELGRRKMIEVYYSPHDETQLSKRY